MNVAPRVSVVMSIHNGAEQLEETIDSVLRQTMGEFEFIIVDDGSSDERVIGILNRYHQADSRVRVISRPNTGLTLALREGCALACGHHIARIDAGDVMLPERLEQQAAILDRFEDCVLVTSRVEFCGPCWEPLWTIRGKPELAGPATVVNTDPVRGLDADVPHHGSVMFRKAAYEHAGGYRQQFYYGQDWDLWYRLAEIGKFHAIATVLYKARYSPSAISMTQSHRQSAIAECSLKAHLARKKGVDEGPALEKAAAIRPDAENAMADGAVSDGNYFIGEALRRASNPACRRYLRASIRNRPFQVRAYLRLLQSGF